MLTADCAFLGAPATLSWLLPNLLLLRGPDFAVSIVLQPTALEETLVRVRIDAARPIGPATLSGLRAVLDGAGAEAAALQEELGRFGTPSRPETSLEDLPVERDRTAHLLQSYVIARVLARHEIHWSGPLYAAAMP